MGTLAGERCAACHPGTPRLEAEELASLQRELSAEWQVADGKLRRRLKFADFVHAFSRASAVAMVAEAEGHHPDLRVGWGYLEIEVSTHAIGGLSRNDFILAAKIDALDH